MTNYVQTTDNGRIENENDCRSCVAFEIGEIELKQKRPMEMSVAREKLRTDRHAHFSSDRGGTAMRHT